MDENCHREERSDVAISGRGTIGAVFFLVTRPVLNASYRKI